MKKVFLFFAVALSGLLLPAQINGKTLTGAFSVSADKQVRFSPGNLQCSGVTTSNYVWSFAENQYDMLGTANVSDGALADKIDLFGWSGSTGAKWGISTSTDYEDYSGDFVDWGTNTIGTDEPNTWRTLTYDEWEYLRDYRTNANQLIGVARISLNAAGSQYANGLVLLPDNWTCPGDITFKSGFANYGEQEYANHQTFTLSDWQRLEAAGAVFLPASGYRSGSYVKDVQTVGDYWSATPDDDAEDAHEFYFRSDDAYYGGNYRYFGQAVRLVQDVQAIPTGIDHTDNAVGVTVRKVLIDGQVYILRGNTTYTLTGEVCTLPADVLPTAAE